MKLYETIMKENWRKGFETDGVTGCLVNHLKWHSGDWQQCLEMTAALLAAIAALFPERREPLGFLGWQAGEWGTIGLFNDHPDTTIDDVLRVLKFADV